MGNGGGGEHVPSRPLLLQSIALPLSSSSRLACHSELRQDVNEMFARSSGAVMKGNLHNYFYSVCVGSRAAAIGSQCATLIVLQVCVFVRPRVCVFEYIYTYTLAYK